MAKFNVGDRVSVIHGGGGESPGTEGVVISISPATNGDGEFVYFKTDSGRETGLFAFRLRKVAPQADNSEYIKRRDEVLSKAEDALDALKARALTALGDFLDSNARR